MSHSPSSDSPRQRVMVRLCAVIGSLLILPALASRSPPGNGPPPIWNCPSRDRSPDRSRSSRSCVGGLMFMYGEGGAKRQISGIVFGGGLALFAAQFLTWLF